LPGILILCLCIATFKSIQSSEMSVYTFSIKSKWRSASIGKSDISEYHYFDMCLVADPAVCKNRFTVRADDWNSFDKGDNISYKLERNEVYPNSLFVDLFGAIGRALIFLSLLGGVVVGGYKFLSWVYDWKIDWRSNDYW
jgi:hypothetical protein